MTDTNPALLIVEDDNVFAETLATAMQRRGFEVSIASSCEAAMAMTQMNAPAFALVDLKLGDGSGLKVVHAIKQANNQARIVVLTGYGSIATAVEAIKLGATHYLPKPANATEITAAFFKATGNPEIDVSENMLSVNRMEWEYIQRVLQENGGNIAATARALNMHRRTLQRKLAKRPVNH